VPRSANSPKFLLIARGADKLPSAAGQMSSSCSHGDGQICAILRSMSTSSPIEAATGSEGTSEQNAEANSVTWKRDYKGCMVTIFGSPNSGWNVQIDKREPIILGYTRPRAIKYAKDLIDEEQAKYHSRSAGGIPRNAKTSPGSRRPGNSFPSVISADRRRG